MPIVQNPPSIISQQTWTPVDNSGVAYDYIKLQSRPGTLDETDGYRERLGPDGWEVERVYLCNWSDLAAAMQWFYGYSTLADQFVLNAQLIGPGGFAPPEADRILKAGNGFPPLPAPKILQRVIPAQDSYRPYLYADHVELLEGIGAWVQDPGLFLKDNQGNFLTNNGAPANAPDPKTGFPPNGIRLPGMVYAELSAVGAVNLAAIGQPPPGQNLVPSGRFSDGAAKIRVTFRPRPYVVQNDAQMQQNGKGEIGRYVERQPRYAIQGVPLAKIAASGKILKFDQGPYAQTAIPEAGVLLVPTGSWKYVWHDVPFYPQAAILACQGKCNAEPFDGVTGYPQFPAQTILCQAPEIVMKRNASGQPAFTVTWVLDYRPQGWNKFPAGDGNFYQATWGGTGNTADLVFQPTDFGQLFQVGTTFAFG